jgi:hypothetical protein
MSEQPTKKRIYKDYLNDIMISGLSPFTFPFGYITIPSKRRLEPETKGRSRLTETWLSNTRRGVLIKKKNHHSKNRS